MEISSTLYGFLDAKFLSYLYNYSTRESTDIEGIRCPIGQSLDGKFQAFEILLSLGYQSLSGDESILSNYDPNSNRTLFVRILDEKLCVYLEELQLPHPNSYHYLNIFLSYITRHSSLNYRLIDLEFFTNIFVEVFRHYRRDLLLCQRFLHLFELFLRNFDQILREKFHSHDHWIHLRKLIDAFWQMTMNNNPLLNQHSRKSLVQIREILMKYQPMELNECQSIFTDRSYNVRLAGFNLARHFFYEQSLDHRLKCSYEQKQILEYFLEKTLSAMIYFHSLSSISEYLSYSITFYFLRLEKKLSIDLLQHILPKISLERILQFYHREKAGRIKDFPWQFFPNDSKEKYHALIFTDYFLSSTADRQELHSIYPDMKSTVIEYFPRLQANLLTLLANKQGENYRDLIEKILTKTEYNRLMKLNLTEIISKILVTYVNENSKNQFFDPWAPQPILPANNWSMIQQTFEYIRQTFNGKSFIEILLKFLVSLFEYPSTRK